MLGYPSNVLVVADYPNPHFNVEFEKRVDFVLSCGDHSFQILTEIYEKYQKPIFAVKGNHDPNRPFPACVQDIHFRVIQHRNWFIGGWQGVPAQRASGPFEWDDAEAEIRLSKFPYVDIFICHAPVFGRTDKEDYDLIGSKAMLKYIEEKQPKYVYHGHVQSGIAAIIGETAVVGVNGAKVFSLT